MARIHIPDGDAPESHRMISINDSFGGAMAGLSIAIYDDSSPLDKRVREAIRMKIAQINQCNICLGFRFPELAELGINEAFYDAISDYTNSELFSPAEKIAIEYAEKFALDHLNITDDFFKTLHQHFSNEEIFVLTGTIAGLIANGRMMQVLQIEQSCSLHFDKEGQLA